MELKKFKKEARKSFDGSEDLFNACWNDLLLMESNAGLDSPTQGDINHLLDFFASQKVNNPRSRFYIYG